MSGSVPVRCKVCLHPLHADIDRALLNRTGVRVVAARFGLSKSKVHAHVKSGHLAALLAKADAAQVTDAAALLAKLTSIEADARRILTKAEQARDFRAAVAAIRELRAVVDSVARIVGVVREKAVVNVELKLDEATAIRLARVLLQRRGLLPAGPAAIEAEEVEEPKEEATGP